MRIIFIPGFGEDETIFSNIAPLIPGNKLILNSWTLLGNQPRKNTNAIIFAQEVIERYNLTKDDILIGHSMGGWIAYHIKHLINCPLVHVGSMTNTNRIIPPVANTGILYSAVKKGLIFNYFLQYVAVFFDYRNKPSKDIFIYITNMLIKGNKDNVNNQLKVILAPVEKTSVQPDLRIHSKKDRILKPPKEPYYEVSGDHFTLYTHPREVARPILSFLDNYRKA